MSSITTNIYNAAHVVTDVVETGASIGYYGVDAAVSFVEAITNTTARGWDLGFVGSLSQTAKWSLGFNDYAKAVEVFKKKPPAPVPNGNGAVIYDMRPIGQRFGEFTGHMINGGCKAVTTGTIGVGAAAFVGGTISNAMWENSKAYGQDFGDFHNASRMFAVGALEVGKCVGSVGFTAAKVGFKVAHAGASVVLNNPRGVFNATGMTASLYFACNQIVKAGESESYIRKAGHCALAALGIGAMVMVPVMNPIKS